MTGDRPQRVLPPLDEAAARVALELKPHPAGVVFEAARLPEGWVFTPTPESARWMPWVVADNRRSCHVGPKDNPLVLIGNLMADSRPSAFTHDLIPCECGHLSGKHSAGEPLTNPATGLTSPIGTGRCGAVIDDRWWPHEAICDCTHLRPVDAQPIESDPNGAAA